MHPKKSNLTFAHLVTTLCKYQAREIGAKMPENDRRITKKSGVFFAFVEPGAIKLCWT